MNENILDKQVSELINESENIQVGKLIRSLKGKNVGELNKKAIITYLVISAQNNLGIFPYNRYMKQGNKIYSKIISPDDKKEVDCIVWCSNHYLGLNKNQKIIDYAAEVLSSNGTGCGTSAVSGGFSEIHKKLEEDLANIEGKPESVLFSTGYTTNLGAISALADKNDLLIIDRESHASIIDAVTMSGADFRVFKHNDINYLEDILKKTDRNKYKNIFILTESVFSMSGDEAPLKEYIKLKKKHGFYLYVDEAHAFGFYGQKGAGLCEHLGCGDDTEFIMSTLSKATASIGGFVATEKYYCSYIRFNSNPYLFQASIPPVDAAVSIAALKLIREDKTLAKKLWENTKKFREMVKKSGFNVGNSKSPIVPVYVSDESKLSRLCKELFSNGIFTNWVSYPVVSKKQGRLRFVVTASHTNEHIEKTVQILTKLGRDIGII
ncbi:MAG: aminotransferase class I/II-fold pyridoxal phosphate-dependent enzyme [Candidatus Saganbacteria bacterium]|nr:aminotransferase class I/II-fold pyridoxal phosphate-dependent enzyme [Candidatus Saganbacteria bacterium]